MTVSKTRVKCLAQVQNFSNSNPVPQLSLQIDEHIVE